MPNVEQREPEMIEVNGVYVIKPTAKYPLGQYITLTPEFGVIWPAIIFGPRGLEYSAALDAVLVMGQKYRGRTADETDDLQLKEAFAQMTDVALQFFRAGLKVNYDQNAVDFILENFPPSVETIYKLTEAAGGERVDEEIFRRK